MDTKKFTTVDKHLENLCPVMVVDAPDDTPTKRWTVQRPEDRARAEGAYLTTFTGREVTPFAPTMGQLCIEDIAHALAHECRFNGYVREFYSVAEHCVRVSWVVPPEYALEALLHDASEAYLKDIPSPLKCLPAFKEYREAELRLQNCIGVWAGVGLMGSTIVHQADLRMRATEQRDLRGLVSAVEPYDATILPWTIEEARAKYLRRYSDLMMETFGDEAAMGYCSACRGVRLLAARGTRPLIQGLWRHICANCGGDFGHQLVNADAPGGWSWK